jgi:hypothetical protein
MKDEQLIRALVKDLRPARSMPAFAARFGGFLLWCAIVIGAAAGLASDEPRVPSAVPATLAVLMLLAAVTGALVSVVPGRASWRVAMAVTSACATAWLMLAVVRAWGLPPSAAWGMVPWTKCLLFTIGISFIVSVSLVPLLRHGWSVQPAMTGALSLAAAGAAGALATTIECPSTAPLHELIGHLLPIVLLAFAGGIAASGVVHRRRFGELL